MFSFSSLFLLHLSSNQAFSNFTELKILKYALNLLLDSFITLVFSCYLTLEFFDIELICFNLFYFFR